MNFNTWVLTKILGHLSQHEGIETEKLLTNGKAIVTDVFGYRYGVTVTLLGRVSSTPAADITRYDKETAKCAQSNS